MEVKKAYRIIPNDNTIMLPSKYDIHDYEIMKSYCYELPDIIQTMFLDAIHKKHAFRNFRELVDKFQLTQSGCDYKENAYKKIAVNWLVLKKIIYE